MKVNETLHVISFMECFWIPQKQKSNFWNRNVIGWWCRLMLFRHVAAVKFYIKPFMVFLVYYFSLTWGINYIFASRPIQTKNWLCQVPVQHLPPYHISSRNISFWCGHTATFVQDACFLGGSNRVTAHVQPHAPSKHTRTQWQSWF